MSQQISVGARITELLAEGKTGPQIAAQLYEENVHYQIAANALRERGFEVSVDRSLELMEIFILSVSKTRGDSAPSKKAESIFWFPKPGHPEVTSQQVTSEQYPRDDPKWMKATRVAVSKLGMPYVDVWVGSTVYRNCCAGWSDPNFDRTKADALVEDAEKGWLRLWWFVAEVEPAEGN